MFLPAETDRVIRDGQIQAILTTQHSREQFLEILRRRIGGSAGGMVAQQEVSGAPGQQTSSQSVSDGSQVSIPR